MTRKIERMDDCYSAQPPAKARECKCNMRTKLVGDGCDVCNPEYAAQLADDPAEAQAQGGGEERIPSAAEWVEQNNLEAAVSIDWRCGWDACRVEFPRTAPPSAPVGVEGLIKDWESDLAEDKRDGVPEVAIRVQEIHLDQLRALLREQEEDHE